LREALRSLDDRRLDIEKVVGILIHFMKYVVQSRPSGGTDTPLLVRVLNQIGQLPNGTQIIKQLRDIADRLYGLDVFGAQRFREHCEAWLQSGNGSQIIIPQ